MLPFWLHEWVSYLNIGIDQSLCPPDYLRHRHIQSCRSLNENLQEFGKTDQVTDKTRICMKRNYLVT